MDNKKLDYSISAIRFLSTIAIIICHIMQYYSFFLAGWFNVGVEVFLIISGYLHSKRVISDELGFYKKKVNHLLPHYYILVVIVLIITSVLQGKINYTSVFHSLFLSINFSENFITLDHLWFIRCILLCYLLTPLFIKLLNAIDKNIKYVLVLLLGVEVVFSIFTDYFDGVHINCFLVGMLLGRVKWDKKLLFMAVIPAIIANGTQIYINYFADGGVNILFTGSTQLLYLKFCRYAHCMLGIMLFVLLKIFFDHFKKYLCRIEKFLKISDKYSYDIYLVHNIFILGQYSVLALFQNKAMAVISVFLFTVIASFILNKVGNIINREGYGK